MSHPLEGVEALLFDVFGTVVDWLGTVEREVKRSAETLGHAGDEDWTAFAKEWRAGYLKNTAEIAQGKSGPLNVDVMHREILDSMFASPKWSHLGALYKDNDRAKLNLVWHQLDGWPDATDGLRLLKKYVIVGTLSNGNVKLLVDMAKHADLPWDVVFSGELLGSYKPNPKTYLGAAHHLSLPPSKIAMVAAHTYDLRAAAVHGMRTVYVRRPTEDATVVDGRVLRESVQTKAEGGEMDVVVDSFVELAALFA